MALACLCLRALAVVFLCVQPVLPLQLFQEKLLVIKSLSKVLFCLLLLTPVVAGAESAAPAAGKALKIGVLDAQRAVFETEAAKAAMTALQAKYKKDIDEGKAIEREMGVLQEKLTKEGDVIAAAERTRMTSELREKDERRQSIGRILQSAQQEKLQEVFQQLAPKMQKAVQEITTANGYDLVLDARTVIVAAPTIDMTRKVTEKLNAGG